MSARSEAPLAGPTAVSLVEEAIQLIRTAPAGTLLRYYAGAVPWSVGFLYFWVWAGWFAPGPVRIAAAALGLSGLYLWLKFSQAVFCGRLLAARTSIPIQALTASQAARIAAAQVRWQPWGLPCLTLATLLLVPFGWAYAYFQHLTVLLGSPGAGAQPGARAWRLSQLWPGQNHRALLLLLGVALAVWINLAAFVMLVPKLGHSLLGVDTLMAFDGVSIMSTTFLAAASTLAWLVVDPLVKAFYVLRVFYGESRRTGEDLRGELAAHRSFGRSGMAAVAMLALGIGLIFNAPRLGAAEIPPPAAEGAPAAAEPAALNQAINDSLRQGDFQWQSRLRPLAEQSESFGAALRRFLKDCARAAVSIARQIRNWTRDIFPSSRTSPSGGGGGFSAIDYLSILLEVLIWVAVVLIVVVLAVIWRKNRKSGPVFAAQAVLPAAPDLQDENVQAAQLPVDAWLALAREKMAAGECRLALRALYLATLVRLSTEGLLALARSKTNLDYERELAHRAPARAGTIARFRGWRGEFEEVWYGRGLAAEARVRSWLAELEEGSPL